jgi:hypothetical protein
MANDARSQTRVTSSGSVTVRQRPALLLLLVRLRAAEVTLELRLAKLKKQCEQTAAWLKRLGAVSVEFGEPHFADQADKGPLKAMRAATARAMGKGPADASSAKSRRDVNVVVTARWHIASMSAEETLLLVDRLRFEAVEDTGAAETGEELPAWASPEEQLREVMTRMQDLSEGDRMPQILFIARLSEEQLVKASAEAFSRARQSAERLARAAEMHLGRLSMLNMTAGGPASVRPDKMMDRQRCVALLAGASYDLGDNEIVSDDPRPAEFTVSVNVTYHVE